MFSEEVLKEAQSVISDALASGLTVASAESCTGGLVAGALTAISGSSSVLKGSVVSYTIEIKQKAFLMNRLLALFLSPAQLKWLRALETLLDQILQFPLQE